MQELENAESTLWTELGTTTQRLDTFETDINHKTSATSRPSTAKFAKKRTLNKSYRFGINESDSRPSKLIQVQKQIDEHGQYGGWPQRDHDDFLKLYSQITVCFCIHLVQNTPIQTNQNTHRMTRPCCID